MLLAVELYATVVGTLEGDARSFDFTPTDDALNHFGANSNILSVAIPLTHQQVRHRAARRRNWFEELLPEGDQYEYMLAQAGLRRGDTPAFLARYGRDVAGALQIWDQDDPTEPLTPDLRPLSDTEVRGLLEDPTNFPLANEPGLGKSSLGGVQPKIVLVRTEKGWAQSLGGYPTTHILKPKLPGPRSTTIFDEEYGARLARLLGLSNYATQIDVFDGLPTLVVERYDRGNGDRIHQEDFSQALGASRNQKYQELGGVVSLSRVADTLKVFTTNADLRTFARRVVTCVALGDLDMHTKNLALLHHRDGTIELAPSYDVVPQAHMPNDGRLAMAVNGKYRHRDITRTDLIEEFRAWRLPDPQAIIDETLDQLARANSAEVALPGAYPELQSSIQLFIRNLSEGAPVGPAR